MTQVPAPVKVSAVPLVPDTAQTPAAVDGSTVNTTGLPDAPPAATRVVAVPTVPEAGGLKVMLCAAGATAMLCCTWGAGREWALPAWWASMTQVPAPVKVSAVPL